MGLFDTSLLSNAMNLPTDPFEISHVTRFNATDGGGNQAVPESGMIALFSIGLLGMGLSHIRREHKTS